MRRITLRRLCSSSETCPLILEAHLSSKSHCVCLEDLEKNVFDIAVEARIKGRFAAKRNPSQLNHSAL